MAKKQSGGVNIRDVSGSLRVDRDLVGGDKNENFYFEDQSLEQKSAFAYNVERAVTFILTLFVGSIVFSIFLGLAGSLAAEAFGIDALIYVGVGIGILLALGFAISATANIKRYR